MITVRGKNRAFRVCAPALLQINALASAPECPRTSVWRDKSVCSDPVCMSSFHADTLFLSLLPLPRNYCENSARDPERYRQDRFGRFCPTTCCPESGAGFHGRHSQNAARGRYHGERYL